MIAANRLNCSHRDPCKRGKRKLDTSSQLPLPSNNDPVCCFLPERTAMVQNFMTRDTWTGDVDETVSVHNRSDPSVGDFKAFTCKALPRGSQFRSGVMPFFPSLPPVMGSPCKQAGRQNGGGSRRRKNHFLLLERFSAGLLAMQIVRTLIAVGLGSYEILRRIIFFADFPSFLAPICLSSVCLSDVCVCVLHQNLCPAASILIFRIVEA